MFTPSSFTLLVTFVKAKIETIPQIDIEMLIENEFSDLLNVPSIDGSVQKPPSIHVDQRMIGRQQLLLATCQTQHRWSSEGWMMIARHSIE